MASLKIPKMDQKKNRILQWNCRGFYANASNIKELIEKYNPEIMALQEIILGQRRFYSRGYHALNSTGRGGAGLLIRKDVPHRRITLRTTLEAVAAAVFLGKQYTVCSIYLPPSGVIQNNDLSELMEQLPRPVLLLGDFNARDPAWGDYFSNRRATQIQKLVSDFDLGIANTEEYTHYHVQTDTYTCIDLSLISTDVFTDFSWRVISPMSDEQYDSDHFPIVMEKITHNSYAEGPKKFNMKRARWDEFHTKSTIADNLDNTSIDEMCYTITSHIIDTAENTIPRVQTNNKIPHSPFWNEECEVAKRNKQRLLRRWQRTRLLCDRIDYKRAHAILKRTINEAKRTSWRTYVSSLSSSTPSNKVWNKVKKIAGKYKNKTIPTIKDNDGHIQTNPEIVAEVIGDKFASYSGGHNYTQRFQRHRERLEQSEPNFYEQETEYNEDFTKEELEEALRRCKDTSPGPDEISYIMIRHLHQTSFEGILKLFNRIWSEGTLPDQWRMATVIPIKKEGKNGLEPTDYRPISLTSCLCKLMERMICRRLQWFLEKQSIIEQKQFGFRKGHSTADPLLLLEHDISQAFSRKQKILAVSFDLEKAYDTTWKWGILDSLHKMGLRGRLPKFIANFLKDRKFKIQIGNHLSEEKQLRQGLPQGAVESCDLFKIAINDILKEIPEDIKGSLYVDDLFIYIEGRHLPSMERRMQNAINHISRYAELHGYKFSTNKTNAILFSRRGTREVPSLKLYNEIIPNKKEIKFLGLIFDSRLTWSSQVKKLKKECQTPLTLLRHLSHLDWGSDKKTLTKLYESLIKSKLNYACEVWCTSDKITAAANTIQNEALRIISGAFKSSPIKSLQVDCNILPLDLQVLETSCRHYLRLKQEPQSPINDIITKSFQENTPWKFRKSVQSILGDKCEEEINILKRREAQTPSWQNMPVNVCESVATESSRCTPHINAILFMEHVEKHKNNIQVYTDGSKNNQGVGAAVVIPDLSLSDSTSLPKEASIFTAESVAIIIAMELISRLPPGKFTVFSDSRSVLTSLLQFEPKNPLIGKIKEWTHYFNATSKTKIQFCWTPAHAGIRGNEAADNIAKSATTQPIREIYLPYTDYKPFIRKMVREKWQSRWNQEIDNKLYKIKPTTVRWKSSFHKRRRYETILTRIRIGHSNLSHVHLMKREQQPRCCGVQLTVKHALACCERNKATRDAMYPQTREKTPDETMKILLAEGQEFDVEKLMEYLRRIDIYTKI